MKHTLVAWVEDKPGVLTRVASLFRRRSFNIESLTVGHTEIPHISRMTIVAEENEITVEQVIKQLYKLINVTKITDVTNEPSIVRELALIKVQATASTRGEIIQFAEVFEAKIVDMALDSMTIEVTGTEDKIESLLRLLRPFGIKEMVRTGRIAMVRGVSDDGNGKGKS
jgi:acetolactate synthase-1/3 small subunit